METTKKSRPNFRRLATLAAYLRKVKPEKFNLGQWKVLKPLNGCGATACAFGHACSIPPFKKAGLTLQRLANINIGLPRFGIYSGFNAAANFFSIESDDSLYLFLSDRYPRGTKTTAKEVARRIENFIRKESRK